MGMAEVSEREKDAVSSTTLGGCGDGIAIFSEKM
jgi:hypothetical protein